MPLAFAGSAGSLLTLTGSPVNVIVSEAAENAGARPFAFFSFAAVGVPMLLGTIAICVLMGSRLLPRTRPAHLPPDLAQHAATLEQHYALSDGLYRLRVREVSPFIGQVAAALDLSAYDGVAVVGAQDMERRPITTRPLAADDVMVVGGRSEQVSRLAIEQLLAVTMDGSTGADALLTREASAVEVVVPPRSSLVGQTVHPGMERAYDLVVLAVQRMRRDRDVLLVDSPDVIRRQAVPWGPKASVAVVILAGMVVLLATGLVPPAIAGLLAATAMVLTQVVGGQQAYRSVSWQTVVLIGGLIPLSTAIQSSGAADRIASVIISAVGVGRPYLLLLALFVLTAVLGQVVSNTATVLIVTPIAVSAAHATQTSVFARPHAHRGRGGGVPAHADRHAGQHDGDEPGWLPVRGLLETGPAHSHVVAGSCAWSSSPWSGDSESRQEGRIPRLGPRRTSLTADAPVSRDRGECR